MQIKTYKTFSVKDAINQIKTEMGSDAVILSTREVKDENFGIMAKPMVEVTAAVDYDEEMYKKHVEKTSPKPRPYSMVDMAPISNTSDSSFGFGNNIDIIASEVNRLSSMLEMLLKHSGVRLEEEFSPVDELVSRGMKVSLARLIVDKMGDRTDLDSIKDVIKRIIKVARHPSPKVWVLLGSTGVGKTTTIAKIAARAVIDEGKKVGLVSLDTYRIGAVEQSRTYAKILSIPFRSVATPLEFRSALARFNSMEVDLVLVDTVGRSPLSDDYLGEFKRFFEGIHVYKSLLIPVATREKEMESVTRSLLRLGLDSMIFTKADEALTFGSIINHNLVFRIPISYLTIGQRVPEDIEEADASRIVERFFGEA